MNRPPTEFIPVRAEALRDFVGTVFECAGVPTAKADFLAGCLVDCDLRGVFSHGTRQTEHYMREIRAGTINPDPDVTPCAAGRLTSAGSPNWPPRPLTINAFVGEFRSALMF